MTSQIVFFRENFLHFWQTRENIWQFWQLWENICQILANPGEHLAFFIILDLKNVHPKLLKMQNVVPGFPKMQKVLPKKNQYVLLLSPGGVTC